MSDAKEQIKERLDVVEVIREYIQLKAVGSNFQAKCPFHQEKSASFIVSPARQIWKCFGCGKGGDLFSFVMEMEGLSFPEALRQLAPKAGVELTQPNPRAASARNRLLDVMDAAAEYYHRLLLESPQAESARRYLQHRGLNRQTLEEFRIGYSPEGWEEATTMLRRRGFAERDCIMAGITIHKPETGKLFDRFRGRIMFPINDHNGNAVAFTARVTPEREATERMGKYVNSPQTPLYDKSRILFGLDKAKQAIRAADRAVVVEGQMDVISSHQAGIKNVVASSGTALSAQQLQLLKRYTRAIAFSFDMDAAGQAAARRGIEQALAEDMDISVITVPGGKDPDECIRNNPAEWQAAIGRATGIMDFVFAAAFNGVDLRNVAAKKRAAASILTTVRHISNPIERDTWLRELAERLGVQEATLRDVLQRSSEPARTPAAVPPAAAEADAATLAVPLDPKIQSIFALAVRFPAYIAYLAAHVEPAALPDGLPRRFYKKVIIYYNEHVRSSGILDAAHFVKWLAAQVEDEGDIAAFEDLLQRALLTGDRDFEGVGEMEAKGMLQRLVSEVRRAFIAQRLGELEQQLREAERGDDRERVAVLLEEVTAAVRTLRQLTDAELN